MTTPVRTPQESSPGQPNIKSEADARSRQADRESADESLGEQLIREARKGHDEFVAGWMKFMEELGIRGKPVGAKELREMLLREGTNPNDNEFSRGIIGMRGE